MLSIIVPVYNVEKYLNQCVDSILAQTYKDFELILIDDGSPDGCPEICDDYAKKDARVKVIHKENGGTQTAIIEGVKASVGEYIGFVDSDDWIDPNMYEVLMGLMKKYDLDCAMCDFKEVYQGSNGIQTELSSDFGIPEGLYHGENYEEFVHHLIPNPSEGRFIKLVRWNKVFKRDKIYEYVMGADCDIIYGEDKIVIFPALINCKTVFYTKENLYNYRRGNDSITRGIYRRKFFEDQWGAYNVFRNYCDVIGEASVDYVAFFWIKTVVLHILNAKMAFKAKRKELLYIFKDSRTKSLIKALDNRYFGKGDRKFFLLIKYKMILPVVLYYSCK